MMKKIFFLIAFLTFAMCLTSCAKCVSTEKKDVEVNIIDEYSKESYTTVEYNVPLKMPMVKTHPAVYRITVEYNGVKYTISGSDTYKKYKEKVGKTAIGVIEIRTYDNGKITENIIELK